MAGWRHRTVALQRTVSKHHHQHFDGGGVGDPAVESIEHILLLHHGHTFAQGRVQRRQGICRRLQFRYCDNHVIRFAQAVQVAVGCRPQYLRAQRSAPTKRTKPLHLCGWRRPSHCVAFRRQIHALHLQRVAHIPNFIDRAGWQRQLVLHPKGFILQRKAVDVHLTTLIFQVLWSFVGQKVHPRIAVVGPRIERRKDLESPGRHRCFNRATPVSCERQR